MRSFLRHQLRPAIAILALLTLITGFAYPAAVTAVAQDDLSRPGERLVHRGGRADGRLEPDRTGVQRTEVLLGPAVRRRRDALEPGGVRRDVLRRVQPRPDVEGADRPVDAAVDALRAANGNAPIPVDLVTASASGLDPDISPAAAEYQVARVAQARGMTADQVRALVAKHTSQPTLGFLGAATVNVLELNLDLDGVLR